MAIHKLIHRNVQFNTHQERKRKREKKKGKATYSHNYSLQVGCIIRALEKKKPSSPPNWSSLPNGDQTRKVEPNMCVCCFFFYIVIFFSVLVAFYVISLKLYQPHAHTDTWGEQVLNWVTLLKGSSIESNLTIKSYSK